MTYFNVVIFYDDYVDDLPSFSKDLFVKNGDEFPLHEQNFRDTESYYYAVASKLVLSKQFIRINALLNESDSENDSIDVYVPCSAIKCIIEQNFH